jgi:uncharacterized protein (TIGR02145 family)
MKKILVYLFLSMQFAAYGQVVGTPQIIIPFPHPSSNGTALVSAYTCSTASTGTMTAGVAVSGVSQTITATVTTAGTYDISSTTNGVTFAASGTFGGTGAQGIVLTATGTPTAGGTDSFTLNTSPNCSFSRTTIIAASAKLGSTYTTYSNGSEFFKANSTCASKLISAQGCGGLTSVTGPSGTVYDLVEINGQCWMKTNLNEVPSAYSGPPTRVKNKDVGWSGVYTGTIPTSEGRLYQWSAAMNGSTTERAQGACPTGFHIPSDCEWMYLEHGQKMSIPEQTNLGAWRNSTSEGNKLRSVGGTGKTQWNNSSGFTALLAGNGHQDSKFYDRGVYGAWWSSSQYSATQALDRQMRSDQWGVYRWSTSKAFGHSVRCLKD